jgi:predicted lipopolysaccharide heptosyltransferase III
MPDVFLGPGAEVEAAQPLGPARWDWSETRRVLVARLRSIGDTVLATPALQALRRFLPHAQIDILLESWVAPVLQGSTDVDRVITVERGSAKARLKVAWELRQNKYDVAYNLHGGTTATLLMRASGARRRVGFDSYQYQNLLTDAAPPSSELWQRSPTHSAEQQLALIGWTGVPVTDRPPSRLPVTEAAKATLLNKIPLAAPYAVIHPAAAFDTKQWAADNFSRVAEHLHERGFSVIAIASPKEKPIVRQAQASARVPLAVSTDLSLPEVTALLSGASLFVGNDSGLAHVAAATKTPLVVIFGSSNVAHWRPWTTAPHEIAREFLPCQPCPGYVCKEFAAPECIRRVTVEAVREAIEKVLALRNLRDISDVLSA